MSAASRALTEEELDRVFRALGDSTRRAMLRRLRQGGATISELAAPFAMSLPAVSKHVRVLERAGLVQRSIEGRVHRCALDAEPLAHADAWLSHYRVFWEGQLDALSDYLEGRADG